MTQPLHTDPAKQLTFRYRNWRGEVAIRTVVPESIWYGTSEWHPKSQWFLRAIDSEKNEVRDFAFLDMQMIDDAPLQELT